MLRFKLLSLLCLISLQSLYAQVENRTLQNDFHSYADSSRSIYFRLYDFNYMRNYEYFNQIADGLTYFGAILQPEFTFHQSPNLSISTGLFIRKDFGSKGIYNNQPIFRIDYHTKHSRLINGALDGNVNHQLPEPIYNYDRIITDHVEYGTQYLYKDSILDLDAWINWENMIYKISPQQERISGGAHSSTRIFKSDRLELRVPIDFIAFHQGGQIDTPDRPLTTILNTAIGLTLRYKTNGFLKSIHSENYYITYKDFSFTKVNAYNQGGGLLLNLGFQTKAFDFITTYWNGNGFQSVHGAPIYSSSSTQINNVGYQEDNRSLLFFRLISEFPLSNHFSISTRLEPYIDLNQPSFEFSNSMFLVYRENFRIAKVKPAKF